MMQVSGISVIVQSVMASVKQVTYRPCQVKSPDSASHRIDERY